MPLRLQIPRAIRPAGLDAPTSCGVRPRNAGAVADVVTATFSAADAEAGRIRSIARGIVALSSPRSAGTEPAARATVTDAEAAQRFDPSDPASMTEERWRAMSADAQRAWIQATQASDEQKRRMVQAIADGVFGTIREFITSERQRRITEITETAQTERERIRQENETRRREIEQETERLRITAQQAANEAAAAEREAQAATNEAERLRRQAEAEEARERADRERANADAAAARLAEANAQASRERQAELAANRPAPGPLATMPAKIAAGIFGVLVVGGVGFAVYKATQPPPPPPPPQLPPGYGYEPAQVRR